MTDRELDALVAEKVMGLRIGKFQADHCDDCGPERYSTSIAAAWEGVEKMRARDERLTFFEMGSEPKGKLYYCQFDFWKEPDAAYATATAKDPSPARAICLAALKAVGVEV